LQATALRALSKPKPALQNDLTLGTRPLADVLSNNDGNTNRMSLMEMLTLRPIATPAEPETITFALPVSFDALSNVGTISLVVDGSRSEYEDFIGRAQCLRATNGECLLNWGTIYETRGLHTVRAYLELHESETVVEGPALPFTVTNLCQFSPGSAMYDPEVGAILHAKLPELRANYSIELTLTNGEPLKTISGSTSNGEIYVFWNLTDDRGRRLTGETFNSLFHLTLPESGRNQSLRGP
jgi:hypothetical protein